MPERFIFNLPRDMRSLSLAVILSALIAVGLGRAVWDMNPWPTDAEVYYLPAAQKLPGLKYLSQMHEGLDEERIRWLHGKELYVLSIALVQGLLKDTETLRPLIVIGLVSIALSAVLVFVIGRIFWDRRTAWTGFFVFASSFWPYLYILFCKHQTQGLLFFLLALFLLLCALRKRFGFLFYFLAGVDMAVSFFSSTVSALYIPYLFAGFIFVQSRTSFEGRRWGTGMVRCITDAGILAAGFLLVLIYVNMPDVGANFKSFMDYVRISGQYNHFFYNQVSLQQWIPGYDLKDTRGGWLWIIRYFFLVMPVVFPVYLASVVYLIREAVRNKGPERWITASVIVLSWSAPVLAEARRVAQYGANYFPAFLGMILVICSAAFVLFRSPWWHTAPRTLRRRVRLGLIMLAFLQGAVNAWIFATDVYPARMATTFLSRTIEDRGLTRLATYQHHPMRRNFVDVLPAQVRQAILWTPIESLLQVKDGVVLLPPVSKDSIYTANSDDADFDDDPVLNEIVRQDKLSNYAVASFKTLGSSLIWAQEEEVLAYRYLILHQFPRDIDRTKVWLLDAAAIDRDKKQFLSPEEFILLKQHIRNIGTRRQVRLYKGHLWPVVKPTRLTGLAARAFKVGAPSDGLVAYVFKVDAKQPLWVPQSPDYISRPVSAAEMSSDPSKGIVTFKFPQPLALAPGPHFVAIYRSGPPSDTDFYRIDDQALGRIEE